LATSLEVALEGFAGSFGAAAETSLAGPGLC